MSGLYEQLADSDQGRLALASARLRYEVLGVLHKALEVSGLSQSDVARKLNLRRSAVNQVFRGDGNVRTSTLAEYLFAMGYELDLQLVRAGEPRHAALEGRQPAPAFSAINTTAHFPGTWTVARSALAGADLPRYPFHTRKVRIYLFEHDQVEQGSGQLPSWFPAVGTLSDRVEHEDTSTAMSVREMAR